MSNPTGDALVARIKELEEALSPFAELKTSYDPKTDQTYAAVGDLSIANARKALNK